MKALGLQDGDLIHVTVGAGALRLTRLGRFLELRGVLGDDEEFDRAMEFIQEAWKQWDSSMIWAGKPNRGRRCTDAPNHVRDNGAGIRDDSSLSHFPPWTARISSITSSSVSMSSLSG